MPALTRCRNPDAPQETWIIHYGDVRVGVVGERAGIPSSSPGWQWNCGFYPGCDPGEWKAGTTASFDEARAAFEAAWRVLLASRLPSDFEEWRRHQAFDAWKRQMERKRCEHATSPKPQGCMKELKRGHCGRNQDEDTRVADLRRQRLGPLAHLSRSIVVREALT